jgi:hypothetical protein
MRARLRIFIGIIKKEKEKEEEVSNQITGIRTTKTSSLEERKERTFPSLQILSENKSSRSLVLA